MGLIHHIIGQTWWNNFGIAQNILKLFLLDKIYRFIYMII